MEKKTHDANNVPNILVVDDTPVNLKVLSGILKTAGYRVRPVPNGKLALQTAETYLPDLVFLDIMMPDMDGFEVCRRFKEHPTLKDVPIIFISALNDTEDIVKALQAGGVDYIIKPFQMEEVIVRTSTHLKIHQLQRELKRYNDHLQDLVKQQVQEISDSQMSTIFALAKLAEFRDDDTGTHLVRVRNYARFLALKLSESPQFKDSVDAAFIENIYNSSPLHDIGKVGIPDSVLLKPAKLTEDEFETIKMHTVFGANTLEEVKINYAGNNFVNMGIEIARSHHEKWNGQGYPDGLSGESIPLSARAMAVIDVYDALRSKRVYKPPFTHEKSRDIMIRDRGTHFDPEILDIFLKHEAVFDDIFNRWGGAEEWTSE